MKKFTIICCSVLKKEIEALCAKEYPECTVITLDSMLHMHPDRLQKELEKTLGMYEPPFLLVYGDCSPSITEFESGSRCVRTKAVNCTELTVGHEKYSQLRSEKAFCLLPEWTCRWQHIFQEELGFKNRSLARSFMHDYRSSLVYIDTQIDPPPSDVLAEIGAFFDMTVEIVPAGTDSLLQFIREGAEKIANGELNA